MKRGLRFSWPGGIAMEEDPDGEWIELDPAKRISDEETSAHIPTPAQSDGCPGLSGTEGAEGRILYAAGRTGHRVPPG